MTSSASSTKSGRERRRFPRYDVEIPVFLRKKTGDQMLNTVDVSRHGAFIRSDTPQPLRQLVQLRFRLPDHSEIDAMCMVARWLPDSPRGAGFGVDFFALSKEAKHAWERFLGELKQRLLASGFDVAHTPTHGSVALPPSVGVPLAPQPSAPVSQPAAMPPHPALVTNGSQPPSSMLAITPVPSVPDPSTSPTGHPDWMAPNSLTAELDRRTHPSTHASPQKSASQAPQPASSTSLQPPPKTQPPPIPIPADDLVIGSESAATNLVMLKLPDVDAVHAFIENEIGRGGMFLKTPLVKEVGEKIDVVLVHPESDDEFHLEGTVVRRVITGPVEQRGLGIFFRGLTGDQHASLLEFADSGVEVVELGRPISQRQMELEAAVSREPDSAEALEQLGTFLLDEEGDLGGALTALTRALVLGPSVVSIHASLARAYRKIGDHVKVRAHERVAEALMLHQDRLKVRLGVGDDPL